MLPSLLTKTAKKTPASDSSPTCQKAGFEKRKDEQMGAQEHYKYLLPHKGSTAAGRLNPRRNRADSKSVNSPGQGGRLSSLRWAHSAQG